MIRVKIIFLLDQLNFAGAQKRAVNLARGLDSDRFEVHIVCLHGAGPLQPAIEEAGLALTILDFAPSPWRIGNLRSLFELTRLLWRERPQAVHTFSYWCGHYGTVAGRLAGVPSIITGRVCLYDLKPQGRIARLLERLLNPLASAVVTISEAVRSDTIEIEGVPPSKVDLVYNGVAIGDSPSSESVDALREELDLQPGQPTIVIVANFFGYKRHETLIRAARQVLDQFPETRILLVGRLAEEFDSLKSMTEELGMVDAFRWLGARDDIGSLLAISTIGVLCSESEAMSNSVLEYMDAGLPVVATDVGGNPEMVVDGETGWLFPVGDDERLAERLIQLIEAPESANAFGVAGRQRVRANFSLDRMVEGYARVYESYLT